MRSMSNDMAIALQRNSTLTLRATLTLADGTVREMGPDDFMLATARFESSTSSESSFDIGACVVGKCSLTLNNHDGRFDSYDFTGATVVPYVGKDVEAVRPASFYGLSATGGWRLEPASDEMATGEPADVGTSGTDALRRVALVGDYVPDDGRVLTVRVRYALGDALADDDAVAVCGRPTLLAPDGVTEVEPKLAEVASSHAYAGTLERPRTVVVTWSLTPQPGMAVRYVRIPMASSVRWDGLDVSVEPQTRTEWIRMGVYNVNQPDSYGGTIALECLDNMSLLSKPYSEVGTAYPCRPSDAVRDVFRHFGMDATFATGAAYDEPVARRPGTGASSSSTTCLQVVADLCQLMGLWCRCDEMGDAYLSWYDTRAFESEGWLDGGSYGTSSVPYSDGSEADGGSFADYSSGASQDGGTFDTNDVGHVLDPYRSTVMTDDVVITGVRVTAANEVRVGSDGREQNGADGETSTSGSEGYVLEVKSNPLVEYGRAAAVAGALYSRVGGMRFRPLTTSTHADPSIEAGDAVVVADRKGNFYRAYATSVTLAVDQAMTVRCSAKSAARNSATTASAATQAIVRARQELDRERTSREIAQADMEERLANASGLYSTIDTLGDGSKVYYFHDKPTVADSRVIWKVTATQMAVSTDGGKTYATGLSATGDAILNRIYAIGIDADYITTGTIRSRDGNSSWDLVTGDFRSSDSNNNCVRLYGGQMLLSSTSWGQTGAEYGYIRRSNDFINWMGDGISIVGRNGFSLCLDDAKQGQLLSYWWDTNTRNATPYIAMARTTSTGAYVDSGVKNSLYLVGGVGDDQSKDVMPSRPYIAVGDSSLSANSVVGGDSGITIYSPGATSVTAAGGKLLLHAYPDRSKVCGIEIGANNGSNVWISGSTTVSGSFSVAGTKSAVVATHDGMRDMYAYELADNRFGDMGESETGDGSIVDVPIDPLMGEVAETDGCRYLVFLTSLCDARVWVSERAADHFTVASDRPGVGFCWQLVAMRRGYSHVRMGVEDLDWSVLDNDDEARMAAEAQGRLRSQEEK